jgi:hypothetical protein
VTAVPTTNTSRGITHARRLLLGALCALLAACSSGQPNTPRRSRTFRGPPPSSVPTGLVPTPTNTGGYNYGGVTLPASAFEKNTWGYVGCSNTHDTLYGYQVAPDSKQLFWPFILGYAIEGHVIKHWADPNDRIWTRFDQMKERYNGGQDPPVIWVQLCENIGVPDRTTFQESSYSQVKQELANLKEHSPDSIVFISPLQDYEPPTLCNLMGPDGKAVSLLTGFSNQAVEEGLAKPGPGADDNVNLGPLTVQMTDTDGCHPNGNPKHGPGPGSVFLGEQLAAFFDHIPQK